MDQRPKRSQAPRAVSRWDVGYSKPELAAELARRMGWTWKHWYPIGAAICHRALTKEQLADLLTALDGKDG